VGLPERDVKLHPLGVVYLAGHEGIHVGVDIAVTCTEVPVERDPRGLALDERSVEVKHYHRIPHGALVLR
jgi:hypothetical protein